MSETYNLFNGSAPNSNGPLGSSVYITEYLTITYTDAPTDPYITVEHRVHVDTQMGWVTGGGSTCNVYLPYNAASPSYTTTGGIRDPKTNNYGVSLGSSFKVTADGNGSNNTGVFNVGYTAYASLEASYYVVRCPNEGFVFVDTATGPKKAVLLPQPSTNSDEMIFIKDKSWNAATNNITVVAPSGVNIDDANTFTINNNGGCLTLKSNGDSMYHIMNYYPSMHQDSLRTTNGSSITNSNKIANALGNTINVFSVDTPTNKSADRRSGDNRITLPSPAFRSGQICVVVYAGSAGKNEGNALVIQSPTTTIDNNSNYTSTNSPYIYTDDVYKSAGAVFICDGSTWFVAGWYYGYMWAWNTESAGGSQNIPAGDAYLSILDITSQFLYSVSTPCLKIIKLLNLSRQHYSVKNANDSSITDVYLNTSNSTSGNHCLSYHGNNRLSCVWFASARIDNKTYYFPVIGYTPFG